MVRAVEVEIIATPDDLLLTYFVEGGDALILPGWASPRRASDLWRHTCFELFLKPVDADGYFEFNFSPSMEWAVYRFDDYRSGMASVPLPLEPHIEFVDRRDPYELEVDVELEDVISGQCRMGLSAVIEERGGQKSYWALAHPADRPDFHHPDCFTLDFPAPPRP